MLDLDELNYPCPLFSLQRLNGAGLSGLSKVKVAPTFGVSFGLPHTSGYPINPFGGYPAQNPYGPSIGPDGLSLGPVSVNPLLSVQVTKDEFGEKVVRPLVNLHVTPNHGLVHKIGGLIHKHKHLHHHIHDKPHYIHEKPHIIHEKPYYHQKPHFKPSYHSKPYAGSYGYHDGPESYPSGYSEGGYPGGYSDSYQGGYSDGYPGGYGDHSDGYSGGYGGYAEDYPSGYGYDNNQYGDEYYRSGKSLEGDASSRPSTAKIDSESPDGKPSSSVVAFPRERRDTSGKTVEKVSFRQATHSTTLNTDTL